MKYRYSTKSSGTSSSVLGDCEICKEWCADVLVQTEEREYNQSPTGLTYKQGWTADDCSILFGHKHCLESQQKK